MVDVEIKMKKADDEQALKEQNDLEKELAKKAAEVAAQQAELDSLAKERAKYGDNKDLEATLETMRADAVANSKVLLDQVQSNMLNSTSELIQQASEATAEALEKARAEGLDVTSPTAAASRFAQQAYEAAEGLQ